MKTKTPFVKTAPATVLALVLAFEISSLPAWAAAPVSLTLKGAWPGYARGPARDAAILGQYAYVAAAEGGLVILDVSDPANPVRMGGYSGSESANGAAVAGNYAYVADGGSFFGGAGEGLVVIDISNPANPVRVGGFATSGNAMDVAVAGNHAYVADDVAGLQVIDVSDPTSPVRVGSFDTSGSAQGVAVEGKYAYVVGSRQEGATWIGGLHVMDVNDPANPVRVGRYDIVRSATGVAVVGNYAYVAHSWPGGLKVIDVSNPANPVRVGGYDTGGTVGRAADVAVVGNLIYVADGLSGLQILEQSRPSWLEVSGASPFTFRLSGEPGASVRVQRSANLTEWQDWQTVTLGKTPVELSDTAATTNSARFFRAVQP